MEVKSESDADRDKRYARTFEKEKRLLTYSASGFVTCTELGMNVDDWLKYKEWLNERGLHAWL